MDSTSSQPNDQASASNQVPILQPTNIARDHLLDTIIGEISRGVQTRSRLASFCEHYSFVSSFEPIKIEVALMDVDWVNAMHEQLNNLTRNQVPILQPTNVARDHPLDTIIGDISRGVQTRSRLASFCEYFSFVSSIEPKKIDKALKDVDWVNAMHEELNNFTRNQV